MSNNITVDSSFSLYDLVERVQKESTVLNHRRTMTIISYEIENATLVDNAETWIFSGFQRLSKFKPQMERYRRIAQNATRIFVFGVDDYMPEPIPNIIYVPLKETDRLAKEWFLVSYGKDYYSALATEELTDFFDPDETRVFKGLWTFDLNIVSILYEWLVGTVGERLEIVEPNEHNYSRQVQLMSSSMGRLMARIMQDKEDGHIIQGQLKSLVKNDLSPAIHSLTDEELQKTEPDEHECVMLFSDMRQFSSLAEKLNVKELVRDIVNPHLDIVTQLVYQHGGVVDKFLGDGVLAVFGMDNPSPQDAQHAVDAAIAILDKLKKEYPAVPPVGIGISAGNVIVSELGNQYHSERTVIGDAVNVSQRLSSLGVGDIWMTDTVYDKLNEATQNNLERIQMNLKGISCPKPVYRFVGG